MSPARLRSLLALAAGLAVLGCGPSAALREPPKPQEISADSVGHFCGMSLHEHPGPKGQVFIAGQAQPVWFASVGEAFAFTMLEEEPKAVLAIYVTDMGRATDWRRPEPGIWADARTAYYVIGGRGRGGMRDEEPVSFADRAQAARFAAEAGGRIVTFDEMPRDYILARGEAPLAGRDGRGAREP